MGSAAHPTALLQPQYLWRHEELQADDTNTDEQTLGNVSEDLVSHHVGDPALPILLDAGDRDLPSSQPIVKAMCKQSEYRRV